MASSIASLRTPLSRVSSTLHASRGNVRSMAVQDTSREAADLQIEIHRKFSPEDRLRMTIEMSEFARALSKVGLRSRLPQLTEADLDDELLNQMYGFRRR